jgi:hypothetical protein
MQAKLELKSLGKPAVRLPVRQGGASVHRLVRPLEAAGRQAPPYLGTDTDLPSTTGINGWRRPRGMATWWHGT